MAEVIATNRYVADLGPIKMEILNFSGTVTLADSNGNPSSDTQTGVDDLDTYVSILGGPLFAVGRITTDAFANLVSFNVAISGKTLTFNRNLLSAHNIVVVVFGF